MGQDRRPEHVIANIHDTLRDARKALERLRDHCPEPQRQLVLGLIDRLNGLGFWLGWTHGELINVGTLYSDLRDMLGVLNALLTGFTRVDRPYGYIEVSTGWLRIALYDSASLLNGVDPVTELRLSAIDREFRGYSDLPGHGN